MSELRLGAVAFIEPGREFVASPQSASQLVKAAGGEVVQALDHLVMAWFTSATGCVRCCIEFGHAGCRAGASAGDVLVQHGLLQGLPVIEASRLKDMAAPNQILGTARLVRLAEIPEEASEPFGEVHLKGIEHPIAIRVLS